MSRAASPSIYDLQPLEDGGEIARGGFDFQDHVAVSFCIEMLASPELLEISCETHDDITLVRLPAVNGSCKIVEFVQVKSNQLGQHWSVAKLCEKDSGKPNSKSILQKSLEQDRCNEETLFRMATLCGVNDDLEILTYPLDSPLRQPGQPKITDLCNAVASHKNINGIKSIHGNDSSYWVARTTWDVLGSEKAINNDNVIRLQKVIHSYGEFLAPDQFDELYDRLVNKTRKAASTKWAIDPKQKWIKRETLINWFERTLKEICHPASFGNGSKLLDKLNDAKLAQDIIDDAVEMRGTYLREVRAPKYLSLSDVTYIQAEVTAQLHPLKSQLYSNSINDNGQEFHTRCLEALNDLFKSGKVSSKVSLSFLLGCMYDLANRCRHRFVKADL